MKRHGVLHHDLGVGGAGVVALAEGLVHLRGEIRALTGERGTSSRSDQGEDCQGGLHLYFLLLGAVIRNWTAGSCVRLVLMSRHVASAVRYLTERWTPAAGILLVLVQASGCTGRSEPPRAQTSPSREEQRTPPASAPAEPSKPTPADPPVMAQPKPAEPVPSRPAETPRSGERPEGDESRRGRRSERQEYDTTTD